MKGKEIWKDILGYEGRYQVSNWGRVKSLNYRRTGKEKILKAGASGDGYLQVTLSKDGKRKQPLVHRLVATAFCENPHGFKEVNHINEDKSDNRADNLEWCSRSYNCSYNDRAKKAGKKTGKKLSKPVIAIDKRTGLIVEFVSAHEAERETGIASSNIINCCQGKLKSCGGFYWMYKNNNDDAE